MTDEDLERAVTAARKHGLRKPEEIAAFALEWLGLIIHLEVRNRSAEDLSDHLSVRLPVARQSSLLH